MIFIRTSCEKGGENTMIVKKLGTAIATAAMFASVMTPVAFADTTITVSGNGKDSDNDVKVENERRVEVSQTNVTKVGTFVSQVGNSGDNTCSGNTGGDCTVNTGKVTNKVNVTVQGGNNNATLPDPCDCDEDVTVEVKNNGKGSETDVDVENENKTKVGQFGGTFVFTGASQYGDSGNNKVKDNTSKWSDNKVKTGKVKNKLNVSVQAGNNKVK